jgi:hypothetical protein
VRFAIWGRTPSPRFEMVEDPIVDPDEVDAAQTVT